MDLFPVNKSNSTRSKSIAYILPVIFLLKKNNEGTEKKTLRHQKSWIAR